MNVSAEDESTASMAVRGTVLWRADVIDAEKRLVMEWMAGTRAFLDEIPPESWWEVSAYRTCRDR